MMFPKPEILDAIETVIRNQFQVQGQRSRRFEWRVPSKIGAVVSFPPDTIFSVTADLYLPPRLHCLVQVDDPSHCTLARAETFRFYPPDTPLTFDVRRYLADKTPGDPSIARADALTDLLAPVYGLNPTVRLRTDEIAEQTGPLITRIEAVLSCRLAIHAGTAFQHMLGTAGAKPHKAYSG